MTVVMSKFPHIEQFRNVIRQVKDRTQYVGKDENGNAVFDPNIRLPVLKFRGTTKIHGTNSGIGTLNDGTIWVQSRENIITPEKDNAGFASFVHKNKDFFANLLSKMVDFEYSKDVYKGFVVYGEFAGKGIQKGVAVSELDKMLVVFGIKLLAHDPEVSDNVWMSEEAIQSLIGHDEERRIFNVFTFGTWELDIDFENPELATNKLVELTEEVERECPVGKYFGVSNIGEGIVWEHYSNHGHYRFKVKGERHVTCKVKKLVSVDVERVNSIKECVDKIITENRLKQGLDHLRMNHLEIIPENLGTFIKWVTSDAIREELDTIIDSGFIPKDIGSAASKVARDWFFKNMMSDFEKI